MVFTTISTRTFTDAVLTRLQSNSEGLDVGDAEKPVSPSPALPYAVLYPTVSPELIGEGGPLDDPSAHRIIEWELVSVGQTRIQAQWCSDIMRTVLQSSSLTVAGRNVWRVDVEALGEIERDDDLEPPLFYATDSIAIPSTPS